MCKRFIQIVFKIFIAVQLISAAPAYAKPDKPKQTLAIAYLTQEQAPPPILSNVEPFINNKGEFGADLAISDNNTTGEFTGQHFSLKKFIVPPDGNIIDVFNLNIAGKFQYIVVNAPAERLNQLADLPASKQALLFDVATRDDALRNEQCRSNVLHLLPDRAMRADALAQYMLKKRWIKWFLVIGATQEDRLFADAIRRATKRFGIEIVQEKTWEHTFDARRTVQSDVAVFSQIDDYDVLVVADEQGEGEIHLQPGGQDRQAEPEAPQEHDRIERQEDDHVHFPRCERRPTRRRGIAEAEGDGCGVDQQNAVKQRHLLLKGLELRAQQVFVVRLNTEKCVYQPTKSQ